MSNKKISDIELFERNAKKHISVFDIEKFKKVQPKLLKAILQSMKDCK